MEFNNKYLALKVLLNKMNLMSKIINIIDSLRVYLINRHLSSILKSASPYSRLYNKTTKLPRLVVKPLGVLNFLHCFHMFRINFKTKPIHVYLLDTTQPQKYMCLDPSTNRVCISHNWFPYKNVAATVLSLQFFRNYQFSNL